jgi:uncharacterized protein (TIGR02996 family)
MTDEAAFLAAIRAAPADLAPRLVYADWLDERGDPRGELIRIEEQMRALPAFADRFWELKPRRNELRQRADPDWLAAFGYGTEYRPVFDHGVPDDWTGRWRLIRESVERRHGIPMGDVGGRAEEVRAAEGRLGLTLPPSVREWVAFAHDVGLEGTGAPAAIDRPWRVFPEPYRLDFAVDDSAVSLARDSHVEDCGWVVRTIDLGRPDPPVYSMYLYGGPQSRYSRPDMGSVTDFVLPDVRDKPAGG